MDKKGFTLIELLLVITIIGILATIGIPAYIGQQRRATRAEAFTNLQNLRLLEEQFFADSGNYVPSLGVAGSTTAVRDANLAAIQGVGMLPRFRPGADMNFSYRLIQNVRIPNVIPNPYTPGIEVAETPCFTAIATAIDGSRVAGDVFVIDCRNNRNF